MSHHHSYQPLTTINETEILQNHLPDPPSYWDHDFSSESKSPLIIMHVLGVTLACFVLLPAVVALRISKNRWRMKVQLAFMLSLLLGSLSGVVYNRLTPNLYNGSVHGVMGYTLILIAIALTALDSSNLFKFFSSRLRNDKRKLGRYKSLLIESEMQDITPVTLEPLNPPEGLGREHDLDVHQHHVHFDDVVLGTYSGRSTFEESVRSESTLHNSPISTRTNSFDSIDFYAIDPPSVWHRLRHLLFISVERMLVVFAYVEILDGAVVYSGICRENYINGCLAHVIKGSIFWIYGLFTFARFLGAYADLGWAWNHVSSTRIPSGELVESSVIFLYGITNTWMERFGATPGSPYTTKQIQHISIAVMFWFGGLVGMGLESRRFKRWLGSVVGSGVPSDRANERKVFTGSLNPIPALVIGVTGAAMSAHHQTYVFQVQIHALWGFFLVGFAVLRCLTYFFLWLRPPHSIHPSRPPTEVLASFFLACGGLTFMFSAEQITFTAMRRGYDDVMMFLNLAVALTCLAFCWLLAVLGFKGWLMSKRNNNDDV